MKLIEQSEEVVRVTGGWREEGQRIVLVPTMGWFHEGHLSLMRLARSLGTKTIVSLFVNPIQFGPREDLAAYPRDLDRDRRLAEQEGVDALFAPAVEEMFESEFQTRVTLSKISQGLCGADRPGHFDGVATIVTKLFHLMTDLNIPVRIVGHPIVREQDGLALSSRNSYLTAAERQTALCLSQAIGQARDIVRRSGKSTSVADLIAGATAFINAHEGCQVDYVSIVDRWTLLPSTEIDQDSVMALAVKINGRVRLIDNGLLL